jgi:hypothetical protein
MGAVRVIVAKDAAFVSAEYMGQDKGEIVSNNFPLLVNPNLLAQNADPSRTPKACLVVGILAEMPLSTQIKMITQLMLSTHHLIIKNYLIPQKVIPPLLS